MITFAKYVENILTVEDSQVGICQENIQEKLYNMDLRKNYIRLKLWKEIEDFILKIKDKVKIKFD